jgi:hypothetical protein
MVLREPNREHGRRVDEVGIELGLAEARGRRTQRRVGKTELRDAQQCVGVTAT